MKIRVIVTKLFVVETEGGNIKDWESINAHALQVQNMPLAEIEAKGTLLGNKITFSDVVNEDIDESDVDVVE